LLTLENSLKELEGTTTEDENKNADKRKNKLMTISRLLERASDLCGSDSHSDVPLCKECAQNHLKHLDTQLSEAVKENNSYKTFLQQLDSDKDKLISEEQLDSEIQKVKPRLIVTAD
jgi:hypothetical protein